jgi:ribonuclease Z
MPMDDTERPFESVRRFENLDDADFDDASSFDDADDTTTGCLRRVVDDDEETHRRRSSTHLVLVFVTARMDGFDSFRFVELDCGGVTVALTSVGAARRMRRAHRLSRRALLPIRTPPSSIGVVVESPVVVVAKRAFAHHHHRRSAAVEFGFAARCLTTTATAKEEMSKDGGKSNAKRLGTCHVQVLGLGADCADTTAPSVLVFTDNSRYVFNVGEGFQRFCVERRLKLSRTSRILLTRVDSSSCGGLVGMLLTMSDGVVAQNENVNASGGSVEEKVVDVHGPRERTHALLRASRTLFGSGRAVSVEERGFDDDEIIVDDGSVTIRSVVVGSGGAAWDATVYDDDDDEERAAKRAKGASPPIVVDQVASYDVKLAGIPGKFDMKAAVALGVPNGPQRGKLVRGETITLEDGTVVTPEMCVGPEQPGPRVIILDLPTLDHVRELMERQESSPAFGDVGDASVVVHIAKSDVVSSHEYAEMVKGVFGSATNASHVFANSAAMDQIPVFAASARIQARLHALHADVFPEVNPPPSPPPSPSRAKNSNYREKVPDGIQNAVAGKNMFKFNLIPLKNAGPDASAVPKYMPGFAHRRDIKKTTLDLAAKATEPSPPPSPSKPRPGAEIPMPEYLAAMKPGDVELVFLGTGSAMPAKYRNVSGFFMQFGNEYSGNIMLDTGEGSLAQMIRRFGAGEVEKKLRETKMIWISHIHADHHVGLPHILTARAELFRRDGVEPPVIPVIGPRPLRRFLDAYNDLEALYCDFVDLSETTQSKWLDETMSPELARLRAALVGSDVAEIIAVPVHHCAHAYGAKIVGRRGWSMVYSGDTRPCPSLVAAAKDATLLVHEATFENGMEDEATKKRHSTTSEAVQTGIDARVYRTILTHFSQRYPKIPVFDGSYTERTSVAFDLMSVDFANLPALPKLLPAVRSLFDGDETLAHEAAMDDQGLGDD